AEEGGGRGVRRVERLARFAREIPRERKTAVWVAVRRGQRGCQSVGRLRQEDDVRQAGDRDHPFDVSDWRRRKHRGGVVAGQSEGPCRRGAGGGGFFKAQHLRAARSSLLELGGRGGAASCERPSHGLEYFGS